MEKEIENVLNQINTSKEKLRDLIHNNITTFGKEKHQVCEALAACSCYGKFLEDYMKDNSIVSSQIFERNFKNSAELVLLLETKL
ncbi:hypothetical protein I7Z51_002472 [Vibrio parahaemolyticus]|uniref:hypothetical protein n=1 Tax=Vibrio TaxID=662 RepID=UPI001A90B815|nr:MULTISPECIES: hypothetical protein [Vibrio]EGQ7973550.1 hypothetical protein [Vibrio parahaemolyticus]MBO0208548.1 hypothetical protein [Vibrio sp. Vb0877]MCR9809159.1 hypothetical protein [Vibrio parahaemolyticus]